MIAVELPAVRGPCPVVSGMPPGELWAPMGVEPIGFDFPGVVPTRRCWMAPCLCCWTGWVPVVPDGSDYGYRLACEIGCNDGCDPPEVAAAHLSYLGEPLPPEPVEPSEAGRRYTSGATRHAARRIVQASDPLARLKREARSLSGLAAGTGTDPMEVASGLAVAACWAGISVEIALPIIKNNILAGAARPRRMPR